MTDSEDAFYSAATRCSHPRNLFFFLLPAYIQPFFLSFLLSLPLCLYKLSLERETLGNFTFPFSILVFVAWILFMCLKETRHRRKKKKGMHTFYNDPKIITPWPRTKRRLCVGVPQCLLSLRLARPRNWGVFWFTRWCFHRYYFFCSTDFQNN